MPFVCICLHTTYSNQTMVNQGIRTSFPHTTSFCETLFLTEKYVTIQGLLVNDIVPDLSMDINGKKVRVSVYTRLPTNEEYGITSNLKTMGKLIVFIVTQKKNQCVQSNRPCDLKNSYHQRNISSNPPVHPILQTERESTQVIRVLISQRTGLDYQSLTF